MAEIFASKTAEIEEREVINAQISRKLAGECMVLLENDGALPIHTKKVALFGNGARATIKGGTGSGDYDNRMVRQTGAEYQRCESSLCAVDEGGSSEKTDI